MNQLSCLILLSGSVACSASSIVGEPDASPQDVSFPDASVPDASIPDVSFPDASAPDVLEPDGGPDSGPAPTALEACLEAGGELRIVDTIDNNDTRDHGPILALDVSSERLIAVSTADATLKFWTLDSFQGETGLAQLSYGPEVAATAVALDFWGELVVAGDSQGVIASWSPEGGMNGVVGGTTPGTALVALAIDDRQGLLAQSDADGMLLVRPLPGFEGETVQLEGLNAADMSWSNNLLYIATPQGVEARDAQLNLVAQVLTGDPQVYIHAEGDVVVAGSAGGLLRAFDGVSLEALPNEILSFLPLRDVTLVGGHPVGLFGGNGTTPYIEVQIEGAPGEQRNTTFIFESDPDTPRVPVQVVADPQGELLFVAFEDGFIELLSCVE